MLQTPPQTEVSFSVEEAPSYVNAKQFHRILKRRGARKLYKLGSVRLRYLYNPGGQSLGREEQATCRRKRAAEAVEG